MDQFFKTIGLLTTLVGLYFGCTYLYQQHQAILSGFFQVFGIIAFFGLLLFVILRLIYGKNWALKSGGTFYFGSGLINSTKQLVEEIEERKLSKDTIAAFVSHIIWRITRIGIFGLLVAGLPIWLLMQQNRLIGIQNDLFKHQNTRIDEQTVLIKSQESLFRTQNGLITDQNSFIDQQTGLLERQDKKFGIQNQLLQYQNTRVDSQINLMSYQNILLDTQNYRLNLQNNLIEAERRGALVLLMSNIMDQMDAEINKQEYKLKTIADLQIHQDSIPDSLKFSLSDPLIGRIAALSQGFLPYRHLEGDTLSEKATSPERGQLLLTLVKSDLDSTSYAKIYVSATFENAFLVGSDFLESNLKMINLNDANLKNANLGWSDISGSFLKNADLSGAIFESSNLRGTDFRNANFKYANLMSANLSMVSLQGADFRGGNLSGSNLSGANLERAVLRGANLSQAKLINTYFTNADLNKADLSVTNLKEANDLTIEQLVKVKTLYSCRNLDPTLEKALRDQKPCLFTLEGCQ